MENSAVHIDSEVSSLHSGADMLKRLVLIKGRQFKCVRQKCISFLFMEGYSLHQITSWAFKSEAVDSSQKGKLGFPTCGSKVIYVRHFWQP